MKTYQLAFLAIALVWSSTSTAVLITTTADLNYTQEVTPSNPTPSSANGFATIVFDTSNFSLDLSAIIEGIGLSDVTFPGGPLAFAPGIGPIHIHDGAIGENGPPVVLFNSPSYFTSSASGGLEVTALAVPFDPSLVTALEESRLYLNVHTLDYGSGEIRGQLVAVPEPSSIALVALGGLFMRRFRSNHTGL